MVDVAVWDPVGVGTSDNCSETFPTLEQNLSDYVMFYSGTRGAIC